ncbi:hypothetical protein BD560DRAFT_50236 [Blakeslea trispora]|nr:hypothetical protein BD560DRAFT_50236 [Blakeslea trispora]
MDELYSPLSFVRGTDQERKAFLRDEQNRTYRSFGNMYQPHIKRSTFYSAQVAAPVRSKRTQHQSNQNSPTRLFPRIRLTHSAKPPIPSLAYPISQMSSSDNSSSGISQSSRSSCSRSSSQSSSLSSHGSSHIISGKRVDHRIHPTHHRQDKQTPKKLNLQEISLRQDELPSLLPIDVICNQKLAETSADLDQLFWRCQCRAFILSRYISDEEAIGFAKSVYNDESITPSSHQIVSLQENLKKFRARLKTTILSYHNALRITIEKLTENNQTALEGKIRKLMSEQILKSIWDYWLVSPFVNGNAFHADKRSSVLLRTVTVKLATVYFKEYYQLYSAEQARQELQAIDLLTRTLELPVPPLR